jgi:hypothetical protein
MSMATRPQVAPSCRLWPLHACLPFCLSVWLILRLYFRTAELSSAEQYAAMQANLPKYRNCSDYVVGYHKPVTASDADWGVKKCGCVIHVYYWYIVAFVCILIHCRICVYYWYRVAFACITGTLSCVYYWYIVALVCIIHCRVCWNETHIDTPLCPAFGLFIWVQRKSASYRAHFFGPQSAAIPPTS